MDVDIIIFLILALVVLFCFTVFAALNYSGLFYEPVVSTDKPPWQKSALVAYKFLRGPYNGNNIGAAFTEVTCIAPNAPPIGIFYDDPKHKRPDRLRCIVGCVIKERLGQDDELVHVTDKEFQTLKEKKFTVHAIPNIDLAVVTDFLYTTPISIWIAPNRVYLRLTHYIKEKGLCAYPMIEIYKDGKILYAAPLSKQEDFFVPECPLADEEDIMEDELLKKEKLNNDDEMAAIEGSDAVAESVKSPQNGQAESQTSTLTWQNKKPKASPKGDSHHTLPLGNESAIDGVGDNDDDSSSFEEIGAVEDVTEMLSSNNKRKSSSSKKRD